MAAKSKFEQNIIGSLMIDLRCANDVQMAIRPEYFRDSLCKDTYTITMELFNSGAPCDADLVADALIQAGHQNAKEFLYECMCAVPTAANVLAYCDKLKEEYRSDTLFSMADKMATDLLERQGTDKVLAQYLPKLEDAAAEGGNVIQDSETVAEKFRTFYRQTKADPTAAFVPTNMKSLDQALGGGLVRSGLITIGARPGMGKTTLGVNLAESIASRGVPVLFVSLEMNSIQIMGKRIARLTGYPYTSLVNGSISDSCDPKVEEALTTLASYPFSITDDTLVKVGEIEARARAIPGLSCIFIDYMGLLSCEDSDKTKQRYEQVTAISASLKRMARRLNLPVVVLCQLNRESVKQKQDKRPSLTDLRDSGAIEQDSDVVAFIHRENYYEMKSLYMETFELIIAKNRHAEPRTLYLKWKGSSGSIIEDIDTWAKNWNPDEDIPWEEEQDGESYE